MELLSKVVGIIKYTTKFFVIAGIISGLLMFVHVDILTKLGIIKLIDNYREFIGVAFFISIVVVIVNFIEYGFKKIKKIIKREMRFREAKRKLNNLNPQEKYILGYYFTEKINTQTLPYNDGTVKELEAFGIILRASNASKYGFYFPYNLNHWVHKYLSKKRYLIGISEQDFKYIQEIDRI